MASKIIRLSVNEDEMQALLNMSSALHELGIDSIGEPAEVAKVVDKISDAYYNG